MTFSLVYRRTPQHHTYIRTFYTSTYTYRCVFTSATRFRCVTVETRSPVEKKMPSLRSGSRKKGHFFSVLSPHSIPFTFAVRQRPLSSAAVKTTVARRRRRHRYPRDLSDSTRNICACTVHVSYVHIVCMSYEYRYIYRGRGIIYYNERCFRTTEYRRRTTYQMDYVSSACQTHTPI